MSSQSKALKQRRIELHVLNIIYLTGSQNGNCNIEGDEEVFAVSIVVQTRGIATGQQYTYTLNPIFPAVL